MSDKNNKKKNLFSKLKIFFTTKNKKSCCDMDIVNLENDENNKDNKSN